MRRQRRKFLIQVAKRVALALALADVALYFGMVRPLDRLAVGEWQRLNLVRSRVQEMQARVARLEKIQDALPGAKDELKGFLRSHVPSRRQGFSRAFRLVQRLTDQSGVQLADIPRYRLDSAENEPFQRLGIEIIVEGPFASLLKFEHALETASDLILVRGFSLESGENRLLRLHLTADLYLSI